MAKINFVISGTKRDLVPVYVRFSDVRGIDFRVYAGEKEEKGKKRPTVMVDPRIWSNKTQTIKQRIKTDADEKFIKMLSGLKEHILNEVRIYSGEYSKDWLKDLIYKYHNKHSADAKTLNEYIAQFIKDAESGERKNKSAMNLAFGTFNAWKGFQRIFNEFQGIYLPERLVWRKNNKKPIRPVKKLDFNNITIDFYHDFVRFLSDEGYGRGTMGRFIKELKMFMKKSLEDGLHDNRQFEFSSFKGLRKESFSVYLTKSELDKIYNLDLPKGSEIDIARDCFMVLCETALRISDYSKVDVSIRKSEDGTKLIYITQSKTGGQVVIPCSARLEEILNKYNDKLPRLPDQYINKQIKIVARMCGIDEMQRWPEEQYGKRFEKTAHKWELITCHTGRRTACSLMYLAGIPTISIMQISGHKTERIFLNYIKVTPEQNALKLASHDYFRNGLKVVS